MCLYKEIIEKIFIRLLSPFLITSSEDIVKEKSENSKNNTVLKLHESCIKIYCHHFIKL